MRWSVNLEKIGFVDCCSGFGFKIKHLIREVPLQWTEDNNIKPLIDVSTMRWIGYDMYVVFTAVEEERQV